MVASPFWSLHTHSRFSANDALPGVPAMVARAVELGYPALGLTDHGSVAGSVQLYNAARKAGIEPLPGIELYVTPDRETGARSNMHLTVAAYSETGYRNLCRLSTLAQTNFYYRPRLDMADFAAMSEDDALGGLVVSTGCYFGLLIQTMLERGDAAATQILHAFAGWFPRVYVELQNHGIEHDEGITDDDLVTRLIDLADAAGLPYLIAQDSHYLHLSERPAHESLKTIVSWSDDPSEAVFPGDGFHMVDRTWLADYFEPAVLERACDNLADLASAAHVRLPELESFSMKVPDVTLTGDPDHELEQRCLLALENLGLLRDPTYADRLEAELVTIARSRTAGLLLVVALVTDFMLERGIWFHARGSASSSLVLYLLRVTQIDPIWWDLRLDRFLSNDRTRPPDVDLDVEHTRRDEVQEFLSSRFAVVQVGNLMQYKLASEEGEDSKGSLLVRYMSTARKQGKTAGVWSDIPAEDKAMLRDLSDRKLISGYGTHAAGYVVAPDDALLAQLPMTWIASGANPHFVTSYGKKDVEKLGFVKLDLLGLRTLTAMRIACTLAGMTQQDYRDIPLDDPKVYARMGMRHNAGVFQMEGYAMDKGCSNLKPKNIADVCAALALFRPALFANGDDKTFLRRRQKREQVPVRHPDIDVVTAQTQGILLYQEQIIALLRGVGMGPEELTDTLDAVKASNDYTEGARTFLEEAKPRMRELTRARGWSEADVDWLLDGLLGYADYSFNKAHAASYAVVAYRSAWMATHHPLEFWTGMLEAYRDDAKKAPRYLRDARSANVRVLQPDVNLSQVGYSVDHRRQAIRKGLISVTGVGVIAATELLAKRPFTSLRDLGERCVAKRVTGAKKAALGTPARECGGVIAALATAGALRELEDSHG